MNVHILEMPLDFGASRHGSDMGPSAIRLAGIKVKLESLGHKTFEHTDIFRATSQEYEEPGNPKAKYLKPITNACTLSGHSRGWLLPNHTAIYTSKTFASFFFVTFQQ